jgi:hypothetical protein
MERAGKAAGPLPRLDVSPRKRTKTAEPRTILSVAAMELGEDLSEGPARPPRSERHHRHESRHEKGEERIRGRSREDFDIEHDRRKREKGSHGKKRRHE